MGEKYTRETRERENEKWRERVRAREILRIEIAWRAK